MLVLWCSLSCMLGECQYGSGMTVIAEKLDSKLAHWNSDTVLQVERLV
jgi:hypothetical protein